MKSSSYAFALAAAAGLSILALAQTPAQAQYRHFPNPRAVQPAPVFRPTPRLPIAAPPLASYTNRCTPGIAANPLLAPYRPITITSVRETLYPVPSVTYTTTTIGTPRIPSYPYNPYNPYLSGYGLYP